VRVRIPIISRLESSWFIAILFLLRYLLAYEREIPQKVGWKENTTMMITSRITISLVAACFFGTASFASAKEKRPAKEKAGAGTSEYTKGIQLLDSQQYEQAVTEFTKAILANDKQPAFYEGRGFANFALQRYQEAGDDFSKAIELLPKDMRAFVGRAQVFLQQKNYQQALADTEKALEIKPDEIAAIKLRGFAELGLSQWDKAIADFTNMIQKKPDDLQTYDRRALAYRGLKNFDAAITDYTFLLEKNPNDTEALTKRGYTYSLMGQYEKAIPDYEAALKLNPQDNDTFSRLQWTQGQLKAKNAPPPTTTTAAAAPTATPEKPSLISQISPLYILIGIVGLILIAAIVRLITRGKVEEKSHIIR
jgi:tetratricopeptide (TPR) repeat protein